MPSVMTGYIGSNFTIVCSPRYSIGGGSSTIVSNTFFCKAGGPGVAIWEPSTSDSANICRRKSHLMLLCSSSFQISIIWYFCVAFSAIDNSPADVREDRDFKRFNRHFNHQQDRDARKLKKLNRSPVEASPRHRRHEGRHLFSIDEAEIQQSSFRASPFGKYCGSWRRD